MKKSVVTLESLDKKIDSKIGALLKSIQGSLRSLDEKIENNTTSIQFLLEHAVMREELRPIIREEISFVESRLISYMESFIGQSRTLEEEVLAGRYRDEQLDRRVGVLEQTIGFPKGA